MWGPAYCLIVLSFAKNYERNQPPYCLFVRMLRFVCSFLHFPDMLNKKKDLHRYIVVHPATGGVEGAAIYGGSLFA